MRSDYYPFGWELNSTWGQRSTVGGYGMVDYSEPKFTGQYRITRAQ